MDSKRILVIDDYRPIAIGISSVLRRYGYQVEIATNGEEGIRAAARRTPDLILVDLEMPIVDGWETVARLRSGSETAAVPIISLSATDATPEKILRAGFTAFLRKPVTVSRLLEEVERVITAQPPYSTAVRRVA